MERVVLHSRHDYHPALYKHQPQQPPRSTIRLSRVNKPEEAMIFTQLLSALALFAASVSATELKNKGRCSKPCKGIDCLATLARISYEPKWCGAQLMEKLARRAIMRPDIAWEYNPSYDTVTNPCTYFNSQDPSTGVYLVNSLSEVLCAAGLPTGGSPDPFATYPSGAWDVAGGDAPAIDYSYLVHASWSTNQVKYVNYDNYTYVAVPMYFRDGNVEVAVFMKANTDLPVVCCDNPNPALTQCRRFY
jgi:hypothetical protein